MTTEKIDRVYSILQQSFDSNVYVPDGHIPGVGRSFEVNISGVE